MASGALAGSVYPNRINEYFQLQIIRQFSSSDECGCYESDCYQETRDISVDKSSVLNTPVYAAMPYRKYFVMNFIPASPIYTVSIYIFSIFRHF
jgi:hypothetical protein